MKQAPCEGLYLAMLWPPAATVSFIGGIVLAAFTPNLDRLSATVALVPRIEPLANVDSVSSSKKWRFGAYSSLSLFIIFIALMAGN